MLNGGGTGFCLVLDGGQRVALPTSWQAVRGLNTHGQCIIAVSGCLFGVKRCFAFGAGFEAFVQPVILRDLLADARFDKGVHAAHVGGGVLAGVVFPCGVEAQDNAAVGLARGDGGDDFGAGHLGDARQACDGGRLNAEKVDEQRVFCAEVLVGQVEEGGVFAADVFDDAAQAFGAPDEEHVVVAVPPVQDLRVEHGVFWWE